MKGRCRFFCLPTVLDQINQLPVGHNYVFAQLVPTVAEIMSLTGFERIDAYDDFTVWRGRRPAPRFGMGETELERPHHCSARWSFPGGSHARKTNQLGRLMGDTANRTMFYGASCKLCTDTQHWTIQRKLMDQ